jgi:cell division transport system permease protein
MLAALTFAILSALQNFARNLWLSVAGVVTMSLILMVVGMVLVGTHWVGTIVDQQANHASKLKIYLVDSASEATIAHYQQQIAADPRVSSVDFTSKDQALTQAKAQGLSEIDSAVGVIGANPLPGSLDVSAKQLTDVSSLNDLARKSPVVDRSGNFPTDYNGSITDKLISFRTIVYVLGAICSAVFGFISLVIIMVTIRTAVFVRRTEIEIMKLVGATDWFVRWPFILEGILGGVIAAGLSAVAVMTLYKAAVNQMQGSLVAVPYEGGFLALLVTAIAIGGAALGGVGSYLGVRRFLTV